MADLELQGVRKSFGSVDVIQGIDLAIERGEFVVFVGPSGCGKSTLLRMIAGLEDVTSGAIRIDGKDVTHAEPSISASETSSTSPTLPLPVTRKARQIGVGGGAFALADGTVTTDAAAALTAADGAAGFGSSRALLQARLVAPSSSRTRKRGWRRLIRGDVREAAAE